MLCEEKVKMAKSKAKGWVKNSHSNFIAQTMLGRENFNTTSRTGTTALNYLRYKLLIGYMNEIE